MRVLLVNPPGPSGRGYIREGRCEQRLSSFAYRLMPISLPSTAALLRAGGHEVRIEDAVVERLDAEELQRRLQAWNPGLVVFAVATPTFEADRRAVELAAGATAAHRTAIGLHVTALPAESLAQSRLDSVVRGEPERTVAGLADALAGGADLGAVAGLSFRRNGVVVHNADRAFADDLDALPVPARELLDERRYTLPLPDRPCAVVIPARGCPHQCVFCGAHLYYGRRLRLRQPGRVADELAALAERGVVRDVVMWSDSFTLDRSFVLELCGELRDRRLPLRWMCNSRVDAFDDELAGRMRAAGCVGVAFGIESGDQGMLDRMRKGTTVEQAPRAVRAAKRAGIPVLAHFVLGVPGETRETIDRTVAQACELDAEFSQFYCATPQPGTALWDEAVREGYLEPGDWSRFELNRAVLSTATLGAVELARARRRAYLRFYGRWPVVRRLAARLTFRELAESAGRTAAFAREWVWGG
jgi:radical SAM superfamily enzyme YgiQ (UPF0313 family)